MCKDNLAGFLWDRRPDKQAARFATHNTTHRNATQQANVYEKEKDGGKQE